MEKSEAGRQFEEIYIEHHDPIKQEEKKIKERRKKRAEDIKEDLGM